MNDYTFLELFNWIWPYLTKEFIQSASSLLVAITAFSAWWRWRRDQKWKRKEALFAYSDSFQDTPGARNAIMMLDIESREVPLWDKGAPEARYETVSWDEIALAFERDDQDRLSADQKHTAIRDSFNDWFHRLNRLDILYSERLINKKEVDDVIRTWVNLFKKRDVDKPHIRNIRIYLYDAGYRRINHLFKAFNLELWKNIDKDKIEQAKDRLNRANSDRFVIIKA